MRKIDIFIWYWKVLVSFHSEFNLLDLTLYFNKPIMPKILTFI